MKKKSKVTIVVICAVCALMFFGCLFGENSAAVDEYETEHFVEVTDDGMTVEVTDTNMTNDVIVEPEISYKSINLNELSETWFCTDDFSQIEREYVGDHIEFDMSEYYYDWVKSIVDEYLFTTYLYESNSSWTGYGSEYLQIKFRSIYDVKSIQKSEIGFDKIIIRGKIRSFNEDGILIEGIDVVEITPYGNKNN